MPLVVMRKYVPDTNDYDLHIGAVRFSNVRKSTDSVFQNMSHVAGRVDVSKIPEYTSSMLDIFSDMPQDFVEDMQSWIAQRNRSAFQKIIEQYDLGIQEIAATLADGYDERDIIPVMNHRDHQILDLVKESIIQYRFRSHKCYLIRFNDSLLTMENSPNGTVSIDASFYAHGIDMDMCIIGEVSRESRLAVSGKCGMWKNTPADIPNMMKELSPHYDYVHIHSKCMEETCQVMSVDCKIVKNWGL